MVIKERAPFAEITHVRRWPLGVVTIYLTGVLFCLTTFDCNNRQKFSGRKHFNQINNLISRCCLILVFSGSSESSGKSIDVNASSFARSFFSLHLSHSLNLVLSCAQITKRSLLAIGRCVNPANNNSNKNKSNQI